MENQRQRIVRYIQTRFGAEPEYLWAAYPNCAVFRHSGSRKWFAIFMDVSKTKLGIPETAIVDVLDIRCSPLMIGSLLTQAGFFPAYHMNKSSWISITLDETLPDEQLYPLLEISFDSVAPRRKVAKHPKS